MGRQLRERVTLERLGSAGCGAWTHGLGPCPGSGVGHEAG